MMFEEIAHMAGEPGDPVSILFAASMVREDAPWLYELAMEVYRAVKSGDRETIEREIARLRRFSDVSMRGPWMEFSDRESQMMAMEFPRMLDHLLMRTLEQGRAAKPKKTSTRKRLPKRDEGTQ